MYLIDLMIRVLHSLIDSRGNELKFHLEMSFVSQKL